MSTATLNPASADMAAAPAPTGGNALATTAPPAASGGGPLAEHSRFLCLGKCLSGKSVFSLYSSDGRKMRPVASRPMTEAEAYFYDRKTRESL